MGRLFWLAGFAGIVAIALLVAFRGVAAASDQSSCVKVDGFVQFCLNVPTAAARRETTVPLVSLPSVRADVRVEVTVPGADAVALAANVDRSVLRVETLFGRSYSTTPRVLVFGTNASFARGAADLFGYSADTAAYVSSVYGGIFDRGTLTIAANWSAAGHDRMSAAIEHELTHLMIREIAAGLDVPLWLDEGVATLVEQNAPGAASWSADDGLAGHALAGSGQITLARLVTVSEFHAAYDTIGRPVYAYCADAVRAIEARVGWDGVVNMLVQVGLGRSFGEAYTLVAGENITSLEARVDSTATPTITTTELDVSGNVRWTLASGRAHTEILVSISGGRGYSVTFTVTTDALGIYRGSFGSTAAPGWYTVSAVGANATFSTAR